MSDIVRLKTQIEIDNEAAVWTWRLDSGELTDSEWGQLEAWLHHDRRHRRAFEELGRTWSALDRLSARAQEQKIRALAPGARRLFARKWPWASAAAAVLAIALGTGLWLAQRSGPQTLSTAVGQQRHVTLADGSHITLNTNTLLTVNLTRDRRDITLRRGEAHFAVTHDAARPFLVHAGGAVIRDVGTQFEVRVHPDKDIDVLVNEGRVEVQGPQIAPGESPAASAAPAPESGGWVRSLTAGEQLLIAGPRLEMVNVSPRQMADELAWRDGALVFDGEPLAQAIVEVGRYTHARIVLAGPQVGELRVSGRFRTDDVRGFLQALQEALPVRVNRASPGLVTIEPR